MKKSQNLFFYSLVAVVALIHVYAYRVWLFSSGILSQGDWILSLSNYSKSLLSLPIIWKSYAIGSIDLTPPFYVFLLLEGLLANLGLSYGYIERITFMWPIALFTIPFSYLFIKSFTRNRIAAFVGAVVYAYNTYFLIIQTGHLTLMVGFALAPLVFLLFSLMLEKKSFFYAVLAGLIAFIISFYEFRAFYLITVISLFYYLYYIFFISDTRIVTTLKDTFIRAITPVVIVAMLNIYWILPYLFATVSIDGAVFNRDLFGKEFFNISKGSTLFHPFWTGDRYYPFITQAIPFYFYLLPIFAFLGLFLNRKNKKVIFYGLLSLIGIFLTKQNNAPFPDVYLWLYSHIPGFGAFREASKFYFIVALGYSVLIGVFVDWIWSNWKTAYLQKAKYFIVVLIVGLSVLNLKPLILGTYGTLFVERTMPEEYTAFNQEIDKQNDFFRTLWIPSDSRWGTNTDLHPKVSQANMVSGIWKDFSDPQKYTSLGNQFIDFYQLEESEQLLSTTSIKYVIVPKEDIANDDNFFELFGKPRSEYIQMLDDVEYLNKLNLSNDSLVVYENTTYRPHFYITEKKESIKENIPFKTVAFSKKSNSQYTVTVNNATQPFYLNFTDSYHPDWRIKVGEFNWYAMLQEDNYLLSDSIHTKSEAKLNSFSIDPKAIKQQMSSDQYTVNEDGSIDFTMTLYFTPQTYSYLGIIISGSVALLLFGYIIFNVYKRYEKKN